jgi:hypothetical protein
MPDRWKGKTRRSVILGPPGWGSVVCRTSPPRKNLLLRNVQILWRRPRPTQGCGANKEKYVVYLQILFEIFFVGINMQKDSYEVLIKINFLCDVLLSILNKISIGQQIWIKLSIRPLKFYQNNFSIWIEDHMYRRTDTTTFVCFTSCKEYINFQHNIFIKPPTVSIKSCVFSSIKSTQLKEPRWI